MKVLLFSEGMKWIKKSGLGRAIEHQKKALDDVNISYTTNEKETVDVVHINTYLLRSFLLVNKMKRKGVPVVYHAHSTEEDFRNSFLFSNMLAPLFRRWIVHCYNKGTVVVTPTEYSKKLLEAKGVKRPLYAISNGIDLEYYQSSPEMSDRFRKKYHFQPNDKVIMSVGLYIKRKGILDFVALAKRMPQYHFIWFGYLNLNQVPKEIRDAVHTELPNLTFAGYVNPHELRDAYSGADLFFFPTYEETEGIVLLEAMAMRQNILIRDIPIYDEHIAGVDIYKGKSLAEFEEKIHGILSGAYPPLTDAAWEKASRNDIKTIGGQLKHVYQKAIDLKKNPAHSFER